MGWQPAAFREAFDEAFRKGLVEQDDRACLVSLPNFLKYNRPESPNVVRAWVAALDMLPECNIKARVIARAHSCTESMTEGFAKAFREVFGEGLAKGMANQEQEPEPEQESSTPNGVVVARKPAPLPCPHSEIVALYHEKLPELARVRDWTTNRQAFMRARWREKAERQSLAWWGEFFQYVRDCPFLMGQESSPGREPFFADLEWLVRPKNFLKVIEGKYQPRSAAA
jgi:hypothetical protein